MLIAQITDCHISAPGTRAYNIAPMAENLRACIDHLNQLSPRPDVVLVTGDITNGGTEVEARHAFELLAQLAIPWFITPGNHDSVAPLRSVFDNGSFPVGEAGNDYLIDDLPVRLIALDSKNPGQPGGKITKDQAKWLDTILATDTNRPAIIFMHHPPVRCSVLESDEDGFIGADLLGEVVSKYHNIERILCGHIHLPVHARWHGTIVTSAPSIGMQLGLDLTMKKPPEFYLSQPACLLHYWTKHHDLITHTVSLPLPEGPFPFEEQ